ncbi:MAG: O-methyltransferase, partial [Patescibacteria group bacterium]|nr:O-methyltransferase [Patescibacteria group bacterium]
MDDLNNTRIKFKKKGYALLRYDNQAIHSYPYDTPWIDDYEFTQIYDKIKNNTLVDRTRCYSLYLLMSQINKIPGHILEVGT